MGAVLRGLCGSKKRHFFGRDGPSKIEMPILKLFSENVSFSAE